MSSCTFGVAESVLSPPQATRDRLDHPDVWSRICTTSEWGVGVWGTTEPCMLGTHVMGSFAYDIL